MFLALNSEAFACVLPGYILSFTEVHVLQFKVWDPGPLAISLPEILDCRLLFRHGVAPVLQEGG